MTISFSRDLPCGSARVDVLTAYKEVIGVRPRAAIYVHCHGRSVANVVSLSGIGRLERGILRSSFHPGNLERITIRATEAFD